MNNKELIGVSEIRRDYGLSERMATRYIKASGKMLPRQGGKGAKMQIQRSDFEQMIEAIKSQGR